MHIVKWFVVKIKKLVQDYQTEKWWRNLTEEEKHRWCSGLTDEELCQQEQYHQECEEAYCQHCKEESERMLREEREYERAMVEEAERLRDLQDDRNFNACHCSDCGKLVSECTCYWGNKYEEEK